MTKPRIALLVAAITGTLITLASIGAARDDAKKTCWEFNQEKLTIGRETLVVDYARTPEEQQRGLAGCTSIPDNSGLYFPYNPPFQATFWMKGMLIPIDIIWIANNTVIGIEENVPPPLDPTTTKDLPLYHAPAPVDGVLELGAGRAKALNITTGTTVISTP